MVTTAIGAGGAHLLSLSCATMLRAEAVLERYAQRETPDVKRGHAPVAKDGIVLFCDDAPDRPGHEPEPGDSVWTLTFPLHDGLQLRLHCGPLTYMHFVAMLAAEAADDADEQLEVGRG